MGAHDNYDSSRSHLIAAVLRKIHKAKITGGTEVEVWGDGTARRELLFVDDLAHYIVDIIDKLCTLPDLRQAYRSYVKSLESDAAESA